MSARWVSCRMDGGSGFVVFFFKQKTAYEMRISDWSSDVCSSDLLVAAPAQTWPEAAAKVRYLIQQFADTPEGHEPRHKALIALALDDMTRLCEPLGQAR